MIRTSLLLLAFAAGAAAGCGPSAEPGGATVAATCPHDVMDADCPFCHPDLVQKLGFCKEHDVAEALCWICKPSIAAAYKAKGDWCGEHGLPESKCKLCGK